MLGRLTVLSLGHLFVDMMLNVLPTALPFLMGKLDLTLAMAGTAVALSKLSSGLVQPLIGHWMDRRGRPWLVAPSLIWTGALIGAAGLVDSYPMLLVVSALGGLGSAVYHPLGMVMVRNTLPDKGGTAMSVWSVGGTLGMALAPLATLAVIGPAQVERLWMFALPALTLAVAAVLLRVHNLPARLPRVSRPEPEPGVSPRETTRLPAATQGRNAILLLSTALFLRSVLQTSLSTFLPTFYTLRGFTPQEGALILALYLTCGSIGSLAGGVWGDRIGRKAVTGISQVLGPVFIAGFLLTGGWLSIVFLGLGAAAIFATFSVGVVYAQELMPDNPGEASGFIAGLAWGLAAIVLGPVGAIGDRLGLSIALFGVAAVCFLATGFIGMLPETLPRLARGAPVSQEK